MKAPSVSVGGPSHGTMTTIYLHVDGKEMAITHTQAASLINELAWAMDQVHQGTVARNKQVIEGAYK